MNATIRWHCPHCGATGWDNGKLPFNPLRDHDRPTGGVCRLSREPDKIRAAQFRKWQAYVMAVTQ